MVRDRVNNNIAIWNLRNHFAAVALIFLTVSNFATAPCFATTSRFATTPHDMVRQNVRVLCVKMCGLVVAKCGGYSATKYASMVRQSVWVWCGGVTEWCEGVRPRCDRTTDWRRNSDHGRRRHIPTRWNYSCEQLRYLYIKKTAFQSVALNFTIKLNWN